MGVPKQKWTRDEETALKAGIAKYGAGKWRKILRDLNFSGVLHLRSNIDLKDKWRNMNITANGCGSRRKNKLVQNKSPMALSTGINIDDVAIDALPLAVSYVSTPNSRPQGPIKRLNGLIVESVSSLKEPGSCNTTNIAALIEDQYAAPPNFKPLVKFLTASDKLVKPKQKSMSALEAKPRATSETDKDEILIPTKAEIDLDLKLEADKDEIYIPTQAEINLELEKMRHMTPEDAAGAAARAVADAEAAVAAAEEAMRKAEAAEAEAAEAEAIAEACMKEVAQRIGGKKTSSLA